jgi:gamma-butyrobetaine dioxygenase
MNPDAFGVLASTPVAFHYINDGHHLHHLHPTIEIVAHTGLSSTGILHDPPINYINYSPPFQAPLALSTPPTFYSALAEFASLLASAEFTYKYTLKEGDAVLFDNRRVLHARTAFSDGDGVGEGESNRWLKGCYLEADALLDRGRVLRTKAERLA